jgi:glycosyltransferase involved in cell wall biosynthesis
MKKICIFSGYYLPHLGGIERYTDKLSEQLHKLEYEISVVAFLHEPLANIEKKDYCTIYRLPCYKLFLSRYPLIKKNHKFRMLMSDLEAENFDFIILNSRFFLTSLLGARFAHRFNIPCILIEHGTNHFTINNKFLDFMGERYEHFLTNQIKRYVKYFFGVSTPCTEWLKHFDIEARGVIYNSVSSIKPVVKRSLQGRKVIISYAGRLIKEKGVLNLISVFEKLNKQYKNIELFIAGKGPLFESLDSTYKEDELIHMLGMLNYEDVMKLYADTDIFVHPSMYPEGLPTSILEAGINNCAVVATDRGGTMEVINKEKYGIIVEENEDSLYNALKYLIENPDKISYLGDNLYERILNNFTWKATVDKFINQMEEIKEDYYAKN